MCTIDPLYCWYYDFEDYWIEHKKELDLACKLYSEALENRVPEYADFLWKYVQFRTMVKRNESTT